MKKIIMIIVVMILTNTVLMAHEVTVRNNSDTILIVVDRVILEPNSFAVLEVAEGAELDLFAPEKDSYDLTVEINSDLNVLLTRGKQWKISMSKIIE